ncbi:hypothetical protein BGX34_000236 [Mortierella sp. NVP85]|nr:hypothetical protein BGX34_000236 [Mortierella sp. NVP85]
MTRVNLDDIQSFYALSNARQIPLLGLGVSQIPLGQPTEDAVLWALQACSHPLCPRCLATLLPPSRAGYRLIDCAASYGNEVSVGNAIRKSGIPREQIFVTTKLQDSDQGYESAIEACELSLEKLGLDYIDLYLIHSPNPGPEKRNLSWKALEKMVGLGKVKSIAYCPLSRGHQLEHPVLGKIAAKYSKSPAQVLIRWSLQKGYIVIPKSAQKERIELNADVFDFDLADGDMSTLDSLDEGLHFTLVRQLSEDLD